MNIQVQKAVRSNLSIRWYLLFLCCTHLIVGIFICSLGDPCASNFELKLQKWERHRSLPLRKELGYVCEEMGTRTQINIIQWSNKVCEEKEKWTHWGEVPHPPQRSGLGRIWIWNKEYKLGMLLQLERNSRQRGQHRQKRRETAWSVRGSEWSPVCYCRIQDVGRDEITGRQGLGGLVMKNLICATWKNLHFILRRLGKALKGLELLNITARLHFRQISLAAVWKIFISEEKKK